MDDAFELPFPQYRCPTCGKDLPLGEARMTVTCAAHTQSDAVEFEVRKATDADRAEIELLCERALGETDVDVFGRTFDVLSGLNLVAVSAASDRRPAVLGDRPRRSQRRAPQRLPRLPGQGRRRRPAGGGRRSSPPSAG